MEFHYLLLNQYIVDAYYLHVEKDISLNLYNIIPLEKKKFENTTAQYSHIYFIIKTEVIAMRCWVWEFVLSETEKFIFIYQRK